MPRRIDQAMEQVAKFGNRRLLFGLILQQSGLGKVLAQIEELPADDLDDGWIDLCVSIQHEIADYIERQIDRMYPCMAWEYYPDLLHQAQKEYDYCDNCGASL